MSRPTILTVVGNRPQYIKCAAVSREVRKIADEVLLDTGQHYDHSLAGVFFDELQLPEPDVELGVGSGSHAWQTAQMLTGVERVIVDREPAFVLVYGDTNSTLAGALAAAKLGVPVGHVEAGLRSFDRAMPEELNRVLADHASSLLFCPTDTAVANLEKEGITAGVEKVGDVMFDLATRALAPEREAGAIARFGIEPSRYVLLTVHRPSNADSAQRLETILGVVAARDERVIFPAHPRTQASIDRFGLADRVGENVTVSDPVGYLDNLALIKNARVVATDSGGMQKEAYFFGVPCVTLRDTSEWVETLDSGWNVLVGADGDALAAALADPPRGGDRPAFYGEGDAAERIATAISDYLREGTDR
jgi:UDP-GlcNAc3NAcA epimerase